MIYKNISGHNIMSLADTSENTIENKLYMRGFAYHQFLQVDSYGYAISFGKPETAFTPGDVIYVASGHDFGLRCDGEMHIKYIAFSSKHIRPLLHYCRFEEFRVTTPLQKDRVNSAINKIFEVSERTDNARYVDASEALYTLVCLLGEANIENDNYTFDKKSLIIHPVYDFMHANYRSPVLPYEELLASLGMTKEELDELFLDVFTMTADEFFKHMRMQDSEHELLFNHHFGVGYAAKMMGYDNEDMFRLDFYNEFKMTPEEFIHLYV